MGVFEFVLLGVCVVCSMLLNQLGWERGAREVAGDARLNVRSLEAEFDLEPYWFEGEPPPKDIVNMEETRSQQRARAARRRAYDLDRLHRDKMVARYKMPASSHPPHPKYKRRVRRGGEWDGYDGYR